MQAKPSGVRLGTKDSSSSKRLYITCTGMGIASVLPFRQPTMGTRSSVFLFEAFDLIGSTTINGVLYGITFSLYCLCAWQLYLQLQKPDKRHQAKISLVYTSVLYVCATGVLALNARIIQLAYINYANLPGGSLGYEESISSTPKSYRIPLNILNFVIEILTMAIQVQRLGILWHGTKYAQGIIVLPVLLLITFIPMDILISFVPLKRLPINAVANGTATYAVLATFMILVTIMIAVRLVLVRKQQKEVIASAGKALPPNPFLGMVAMVVESYFFASAWSLATVISVAVGSPSRFMFITNDSTIKIIAYLLVVYRVETGRGWTVETEHKIATLQWSPPAAQSATEHVSGIRSQVPATTSVLVVDSLPVTHSVSAA